MQGTQVRSLVWEDSTRRGAAKPVHHDRWSSQSESATREASKKRLQHKEEQPPLTEARGSPGTATETQQSQK